MSTRTTITLDPDVAAMVRRAMAERGVGFKEAVNDALRSGLGRAAPVRFRTPTFRMGRGAVPLDKALQLAGTLEDEELARRLAMRK